MNKKKNIPIAFSFKAMGLPVIPVILFDNNILLLIDTGSDRSIMDLAVYEHYKERIKKTTTGQNIASVSGTSTQTIEALFDFFYEDLSYSELFICMDCSTGFNQVLQDTGYQIHGILGTDFLLKYKWIIDFEKQQIRT